MIYLKEFKMIQDNCTVDKVKDLIQRDNLMTKNRSRGMIYKRAYLYHILRIEGLNLTDSGRLFNRDHATVINALKIHENYYKRDKIYDKIIQEYEQIFYPVVKVEIESQDTIFQDVMNCHNTTALKLIKDKIMAGGYDKVPTLLFYAPIIFLFFEGTPIKMLVHLSRFC